MLEHIEPCPYCGSRIIDTERHVLNGWNADFSEATTTMFAVYCTECGAYMSDLTLDKAIKKWNRRTPNWIKVDDKKPDDPRDVLAVYKCGKHSYSLQSSYNFGTWISVYDEYKVSKEPEEVTHWMLMPEPPKNP